MNRRHFFAALATSLAVPLAPRRVYSFLWDNPLVEVFQPSAIFEITGAFPFAEPGMMLQLNDAIGSIVAGRIVAVLPDGVRVTLSELGR